MPKAGSDLHPELRCLDRAQLLQARKALLDCERCPQREGCNGKRRRVHPCHREYHTADNKEIGMIVGAQISIDYGFAGIISHSGRAEDRS